MILINFKNRLLGVFFFDKKYDENSSLNIGTGLGTCIRTLVDFIVEITEFDGEVVWESDRPDGQYRKVFNIDRMKEALDWEPPTNLAEGLEKTIEWFRKNYVKAIERW